MVANKGRACLSEGCSRPALAKGLCRSHYWRLRRYRLSPDEYQAKLAEQGGVCGMCGGELGTRPHIDHDHSCCADSTSYRAMCGTCIRDILCHRCNVGLSYIEDQQFLANAQAYLNRWGVRDT